MRHFLPIARRATLTLLAIFLAVPRAQATENAPGSSKTPDNQLSAEERAQGWKLLFNGKNLTGWKCNTGEPIATKVEDGCLAPYKSGGYVMMYDKPFGDFNLKCDVKMGDADCNSGVFFRVGDPKDPIYTGFEVQVMAGKDKDYHSFGSIYDLVAPNKNVSKGPGEWNAIEITCKGPLIAVLVNGQKVAEMNCDDWDKKGLRLDGSQHKFGVAIKDLPRKGYLGFQDHGHPCWYKNVKILELK